MDNKKIALVACILVIFLMLTHTAQAGDWPMRGHDSTHSGVSDEVVAPPLMLLWQYKTGDSVLSSPAISNGLVYVGSNDDYVYAIDANSGELKWKYKTGGDVFSSPVVSGNIVYVGSNDNYIYSIDTNNGELKWRYNTGDDVKSSPVVSENIIYVGSNDDYLYALDANNGELKWKYAAGGDVFSSPAVLGNKVYTVSDSFWSCGRVTALDAGTGELNFHGDVGGLGSIFSSPAISSGVIYIGSDDEFFSAIDANNGEGKWAYRIINRMWRSSPAISKNTVYVGSADNVYALDANNGEPKWTYNTGGAVFSSPAISGNIVYVGSNDNYIYALDAYTGDLKWRYETGGDVYSSPAISDDKVFIGSKDGYIYAFTPVTSAPTSTSTPIPIPATGLISISSIPSGASVYLDGAYKGTTPHTIASVSTGSHTIKLMKTGYVDKTKTVNVVSDITTFVSETLTPIPPSTGSISISSSPTASVYLDGAYKGTTPYTITSVSAGSHTIKLTKTGYVDITKTVNVVSHGTTSVSETLTLIPTSTGSIKATSNPSGANIYLDGTFKGTTPTTLSNVPIGSHVIKITKSGYNEISKSVTVSSSHTTYISENLESIIISHPTTAVTEEQTSSPTYNKGIFYEKNNTTLPIIFVFTILMLIFIIKRRKKSADPASNSNSPPPSKATPPTPTPVTIQKLKDKGTIDIKSAFQYQGATIQYKVKIINQTPEPLSDIKIQLFVPDVFMLTQKEKSIPMLEPDESKTVTFDIRPTGECGDCAVSGRMNYYDYGTKKRQDIDIEKKMISIVCPVLKRKEIDEDGWRNATEELIKAEENTKDLDIPAENLFNIATRVLKDMSMYMIKPEIINTPQLFTGVSMFYAEGAAGLRYAAYIEVVGGRKSRMILKAWAEKEEALTGFYHKILDEIEKRLDIKIFIDEGIIQYHVHKTEIKDNIIQRSNIDLGSRAQCLECGREVEDDEKFCLGCGAKL